jgi:hypothetical protein
MNKFYKRFFKIVFIIIIFMLISSGSAYAVFELVHQDFEDMSPEEMHQVLKENRELAIEKAEDAGDYKCCIHPACTMCYDSANKWNYGQAGKCFCDEFIANGEEPCPQCENALNCESGEHPGDGTTFCEIN